MVDRIVCWFSCGAASAVATMLAITENAGRLPLVVARCVVDEEHPDNDRFAADCEKWFGVPILNLTSKKYGSSIFNVFEQRQYISGVKGAPCTKYLKKEVRMEFQTPRDRHIFGYCSDEQDRWDDFLDANNIDAQSPLLERGITHDESLAIIERAGIELPAMYKLGFKHNNCIGCAKATGMGYWNKVRDVFPMQFHRMATFSRKLGARLIRIDNKRAFLDELQPGTGDYESEPEIQCGIFCEMAEREIKGIDHVA